MCRGIERRGVLRKRAVSSRPGARHKGEDQPGGEEDVADTLESGTF